MSQHRHLAVVGGAATVLASTALAAVYESSDYFLFVFDSPNWILYVAAGVAAVVGAAIGARSLRAPQWLQPLAGLGGLALYVSIVFGQGHEILGVIPTPATASDIGGQLKVAFGEIVEMAVPVPVHRGLLLLAVLGVGLVAVVVDFLVATVHRPSLAGLPLLILYAVPVAIDREGLSWWMFGFGAIGYLWLLVTEQLTQVRRWGRPFRAQSDTELLITTSLGTTGRWVGLCGILAAVVLPVVIPISTTGWFGENGEGPFSGVGGRSVSTINPITQLKGRLIQRDEVELLRLRTSDPGHFYLRLTTLDRFSNQGWAQRDLIGPSDTQLSRGAIRDDDIPAGVATKKQSSEIEITRFDGSPHLPLFANPSTVKARGDWRWDKRYDTAFSTRNTTRGLKYSFNSERVLFDAGTLAKAPAVNPDAAIAKDDTDLGTVEPGARALVQTLLKGKTTQYEKVVAIHDHFSPANGFVYDTQTTPGTTGSDLMDFLANKRGYCEQYASAMAYLVRAAGIPARVAIGFANGRIKGGYTSITNRDAHAWVEVYFDGVGWVPFDPTPGGGQGRGDLPWEHAATDQTPSTGGNVPANPAPVPSGGPIRDPNRGDLGDAGFDAGSGKQAATYKPAWWTGPLGPIAILIDGTAKPDRAPWWLWVGGAALLLLVLAAPGLWRWETRRIRLAYARGGVPAGDVLTGGGRGVEVPDAGRPVGPAVGRASVPGASVSGGAAGAAGVGDAVGAVAGGTGRNPLVAAHSAWDELMDALVDLGIPVEDADTPRGVVRLLAQRNELDEQGLEAARLLAAAEEEVRYGPLRTVRGGIAHRTDLAQTAEVVIGQLMGSAPRRVRIRALVLPPSLVARTVRAVSSWGEHVSEWLASARLFTRRLMPRRPTPAREEA